MSEVTENRLDERIDGFGIGDVADYVGRDVDRLGGSRQRGLLASGDDHLGTALGKAGRNRPANAAARAGDEYHLTGHGKQGVVHLNLLSLPFLPSEELHAFRRKRQIEK